MREARFCLGFGHVIFEQAGTHGCQWKYSVAVWLPMAFLCCPVLRTARDRKELSIPGALVNSSSHIIP